MKPFIFALIATTGFAQIPNRFEQVPSNERAQIENLGKAIATRVAGLRDAHPKAHGCIGNVSVQIRDDIDTDLRVGFFSQPGKIYDAIIRSSSGSSDVQTPDYNTGTHGLALKIFLDANDQQKLVPLHGETEFFLDESYYKTFDIITISELKEFMVENVEDYPAFFAAQGASQKAMKEALAAGRSVAEASQIAGKVLADLYINPPQGKKRLREGKLMAQSSQARPTDLTALTYGSWVPSLLGSEAVKYQIAPCKAPSEILPADLRNPNFLKTNLAASLRSDDLCFTLSVQLHQPGFLSVEDAVAAWDESISPYRPIANIRIPKKSEGQEFIADEICEKASFHPGHASAEHYPIGGIQRARVGGKDFTGIYTLIHRARNSQ